MNNPWLISSMNESMFSNNGWLSMNALQSKTTGRLKITGADVFFAIIDLFCANRLNWVPTAVRQRFWMSSRSEKTDKLLFIIKMIPLPDHHFDLL